MAINLPDAEPGDEGQVVRMWISVHDQVFTGKSRNLADKIGCSQNEAVGLLVRMWLWGLSNCNRQGLVEYGTPKTIAEALTPGLTEGYNPLEIVQAMIDSGYLDIMEDGAIYMHDWEDWQRYWYSYKDRKDKDAEKKRETRKKPAELDQPSTADEPKPKPKPKAAPKENYPAEFIAFWDAYPHRKNASKIGAYEKYNARLKEGWTSETLLEAATRYASYIRREHKEERFVMHPETFLGYKLKFKEWLPEKPDAETTEGSDWTNPFERWSGRK